MSEEKRFDRVTYKAAQQYLKAALEHMIAAGHSVGDFIEFSQEKFGDGFLPYLRQFLDDVRQQRVRIKGLTKSAKTAIIGHHISPREREDMIREVAYMKAEQRGFMGGSSEEDWYVAEKEVDLRLAKEAGLVEKGRKVLTSATTIVEKELDNIKNVIGSWIEKNRSISRK
jgi:hypothetical protein